MDAAQIFRDQFNPQGEAEAKWLEGLFHFVREHVWPLMVGSDLTCPTDDEAISQLSASVIKRIQGTIPNSRMLPVSYTLTCVSELLSHQRLACASYPWPGTDRERAATPGRRVLPRERLLLMGRLTHGGNGEWMLTDASGSVVCEIVSPSPLWMGRLVFLPHWHYFPHNAVGQEPSEPRGHVELIGSPVLLRPGPTQQMSVAPAAGVNSDPVPVKEALSVVYNRVRGQLVSVCGQVASVCPTLTISGMSFFFFTLSEDSHVLPVLVKTSSKLWWAKCMSVGECVRVTALCVSVLRVWGGNNILCATDRSEMHKMHDREPVEEAAEEEAETSQPDSVRKRSSVISYQGTVTEVVSAGAGLFVMDGKLGLCLAYRPEMSRKLRVGDELLLHRVHFLHRPCPDYPPNVLCACLRTTVTVTKFSSDAAPATDRNCPDDGVLQRLLVERNLDVSRYLWTCQLCAGLQRSLLPSASQQCVCVLSWKLMEAMSGRGPQNRRNIYVEMLDEPHACPLTQYGGDRMQHQYTNLSELRESLEEDCWASLSLSSLLPPGGGGLTSAQMNAALSWSSRILTSDPAFEQQDAQALRQRPLLVVGVLELPSGSSFHTLQLRDCKGAVACVFTETNEEDDTDQSAAFNTAWLGCLVCVEQFTMVTERYIQSDFPSYQHLDQHKFITYKNCSVYLQFSQKSVRILSPSVAMQNHLCEKGAESEEKMEVASCSVTATTCVSVVLRVEQKDGVTWREEEASFSVKATAIGPLATWGRDPKNGPIKDFETGNESTVTLLCSGVSARWFPLLQPGRFYRLVGIGVNDDGEFRLSRDVALQVCHDWKFYTLRRRFHSSANVAAPFTMSQVLDCRADVVCFQGLVTERLNLNDKTKDAGNENIDLRLTVCEQSGRSLHVYLNLNQKTYQPGLLPGNTLLFSAFRRRVSRSGRVYCSNIAVSWVAVVRVQDKRSEEHMPAPIMQLALWTDRSRTVGRVKGHLVRFLFMELQWKCSTCGRVYAQSACSGQCLSTSAFFDSTAKLVVEDGTGEAHVRVAGTLVRQLLGLSDLQWEGLQRALKARGTLQVYPHGRSQACDDDDLLHFLLLCARGVNALFLTCRREFQGEEGPSHIQVDNRSAAILNAFVTSRHPIHFKSIVIFLMIE
ncbi:CST complex subunit CTC1 isoform X1 [Corythoichthys intestinalis]|uniref:CST complex subunit CTC1 isoform X1 n=1 Tax=Corythoichthys intestinalis TaxID=161448 RepID=UPI0025A56577|nr:CST complex subunit CTC1 isoform X1 [Corythoichthys intestinalis]